MAAGMSIGRLSRETGVKATTIRFYEEIGLLPSPLRSDSNRRLYQQEDVSRLRLIRHARDLGFEVGAIRDLLSLASHPEQPCAQADELARTHLASVDAKITRLLALRDELQAMVQACNQGTVRDCRVIEVLANHSECLHDSH